MLVPRVVLIKGCNLWQAAFTVNLMVWTLDSGLSLYI